MAQPGRGGRFPTGAVMGRFCGGCGRSNVWRWRPIGGPGRSRQRAEPVGRPAWRRGNERKRPEDRQRRDAQRIGAGPQGRGDDAAERPKRAAKRKPATGRVAGWRPGVRARSKVSLVASVSPKNSWCMEPSQLVPFCPSCSARCCGQKGPAGC